MPLLKAVGRRCHTQSCGWAEGYRVATMS